MDPNHSWAQTQLLSEWPWASGLLSVGTSGKWGAAVNRILQDPLKLLFPQLLSLVRETEIRQIITK